MFSEYHKQLLLRSLDFELSPGEQAELEAALERSAELRAEKAQLQRVRQLLGEWEPRRKASVVSTVMARVARAPVSWEARIINLAPRVAAASIVLLLTGMLTLYFADGQAAASALVNLETLTPEDAYVLLSGM